MAAVSRHVVSFHIVNVLNKKRNNNNKSLTVTSNLPHHIPMRQNEIRKEN
jgi:hypothetical protein